MGDEALGEDEVDGSLADDLVGDVDAAAPRELDPWRHDASVDDRKAIVNGQGGARRPAVGAALYQTATRRG